MSNRYIGGFIRPGYDLLKVPNAPTIGAVTAANSQVSVAFTAPSCVGGGAITSYTAYTSCNITAVSNTSSPVVVTGLTNGTSYTFRVIANNAFGPSSPSGVSASATPVIIGQQAFTTAGTYTWVAPAGVTSVSVVAVGAGGNYTYGSFRGGGGGALAYANNISVTPGNSYSVVVGNKVDGSNGGTSSFDTSVSAQGGRSGGNGSAGGSVLAGSGGSGGNGAAPAGEYPGGGGGAGGYAGTGGNGGAPGTSGTAGTGGAGGGGAGAGGGDKGPGGGGVGILGQGSNGGGGGYQGGGGGGGSGGANGEGNGAGGAYGGGSSQNSAAAGAVRIIWPGTTRSFPSTNTGDL